MTRQILAQMVFGTAQIRVLVRLDTCTPYPVKAVGLEVLKALCRQPRAWTLD